MSLSQLCRCCNSPTNPIFSGFLLAHEVGYFDCSCCGYVQTETPYWLDQAYTEAINESDTGIMARNQANARIVLAILFVLGKLDGTVVDCAGGYGILVRLLRDYGINALWSDRYCKNLLARGFEYCGEPAALVTSFEAFEHFVNPAAELDSLLNIAPNVLISTEIISSPAPEQSDWWYYGKDHGQHIGFFRLKTLEKMAKDRGKYLVSDGGSYHLMTSKPVSKSLFKAVVRLNKIVPLIGKHKLTSKIWTDHELMAKNSLNSHNL